MDLLIETINQADLGWKADTCKLQAHHPSYGSHCEEQIRLAQQGKYDDDGVAIQIDDTNTKEFGHGDGWKETLA